MCVRVYLRIYKTQLSIHVNLYIILVESINYTGDWKIKPAPATRKQYFKLPQQQSSRQWTSEPQNDPAKTYRWGLIYRIRKAFWLASPFQIWPQDDPTD